jgi:glycosyltransferase involved in cell wall biosynthesis
VLENCSGEYIAMLDGDDRWDDPFKLKKQIEFLDNHQDYILSCHRYHKYLLDEQRFDEDYMWPDFFISNPNGFPLDSEKFYSHWFTQTLTVVFRRSALDIKEIKSYRHFKDVHLIYSLLKRGKGYVHSFFGAVYNIHHKGIWNGMSEYNKIKNDFHTLDEIIKKDGYVKHLSQIHFDKLKILAQHEFKYKWKLKMYNFKQRLRKRLGMDRTLYS